MKATLLLLVFCFAFAYANLDDYVNTPHHRVHKNCVHHIPSGTHVHRDDIGNYFLRFADGSEKMHPPCEYPPMVHGRAWKAWTRYHNTDGFTFMSANWPAPPAPAVPSNIEILYYWPGTEPDDNSFVIQPVLQYGAGPAGGGQYWAIASWYVGDRAFFSNLVDAEVGDMMFGSMEQTDSISSNNSTWTIISENVNSDESVSLVMDGIITQTYAYCVLEAYNLINCATQYPANTTSEPFTNLVTDVAGQSSTPQWVSRTKDPRLCNERTTITSPTEVAIV